MSNIECSHTFHMYLFWKKINFRVVQWKCSHFPVNCLAVFQVVTCATFWRQEFLVLGFLFVWLFSPSLCTLVSCLFHWLLFKSNLIGSPNSATTNSIVPWVSKHSSNMLVYPRGWSAQTTVKAAILRQMCKLAISPSYSILTVALSQPIGALLSRQMLYG